MPATRRAIAATVTNNLIVKIGNSIRKIDIPTTAIPNTIFVTLVELLCNLPIAPKPILSIPKISNITESKIIMVAIPALGRIRIIVDNKTEIDPITICNILNQGGVISVCIITFTISIEQLVYINVAELEDAQTYSVTQLRLDILQ